MIHSKEELLAKFDNDRKALGLSRRAYGIEIGISAERVKSFFRADRDKFKISHADSIRIIEGKSGAGKAVDGDGQASAVAELTERVDELLERLSFLERGMIQLGVETGYTRKKGHSRVKKKPNNL